MNTIDQFITQPVFGHPLAILLILFLLVWLGYEAVVTAYYTKQEYEGDD